MLKQRLITALLIAVLLIGILFFAPLICSQILIGLVVVLGLWEWLSLCKLTSLSSKISYSFSFVILFLILEYLPFVIVMSLSVAIWIGIIFFLYFSFPKKTFWLSPLAKKGWGCFVLMPFALGLLYLVEQAEHARLLLFLLLSISAADSGAYFVGRAWGRHKLAPHVSPNKSIEGLIGGLLMTGIVIAAFTFYLGYDVQKALLMIGICMLTALLSAVGDLFESAMKRDAGVKDSGNILPGHGGILDRIDAYTAGVPLFALMVYLFL